MTQEMTKAGTEVELLDVRSGEVLRFDVREAPDELLAEAIHDVVDAGVSAFQAADAAMRAELLRRLDKSGAWTRRVREDGADVEYEVKAPSPSAGTITFDLDVVRDGLRDLVDQDVVDEQAAGAALERTISLVATVPLDCDLDELAGKLSFLEAVADVPVTGVKVAPAERVVKGGMDRLVKIGGKAAELVANATRTGPTPTRRVKVSAKQKRR